MLSSDHRSQHQGGSVGQSTAVLRPSRMAAAVVSMVAKSSSSLCSQLSISWDASNFCRKRTFFATCSSHSNSPFTESYSVKPLRGAGKLEIISNLYTVLSHERKEGTRQHGEDFLELEQEQEQEHDIATPLPEVRQLLSLLHNDERKQEKAHGIGNVFLVGTGPGDSDLLTVKALKLMQTADLVLYDRLVSTDILDLVHAGARLLYVGKTAGYHSRTQDEIHQLLLSFAEAGATVLRLKGGDPLFQRTGVGMAFGGMPILFFRSVLCLGSRRCLEGVVKKWISCNSRVFMCGLFQNYRCVRHCSRAWDPSNA